MEQKSLIYSHLPPELALRLILSGSTYPCPIDVRAIEVWLLEKDTRNSSLQCIGSDEDTLPAWGRLLMRTDTQVVILTHLCLASHKRDTGKQYRPWSDAAERAASDQGLHCLH